ncbi:MAG: MmcQ/YjbR family DNA-binding protein [Jatrophihabitantaceae bacterium]
MATTEQVRRVALSLPRTTEGLVRDRVKFRVGPIVYLAISPDDTRLGFGYPKEQREALIASDPVKFSLPGKADLRYHWAVAQLAELDRVELAELVLDAWCIVVSAKTSAAYLAQLPEDWSSAVYRD